jgi:hypothetical protein
MRSAGRRTPHFVVVYEVNAGRVVRNLSVLDCNFHINVANVLQGFQKAAAARQHHPSRPTTRHLPILPIHELALYASQVTHLH